MLTITTTWAPGAQTYYPHYYSTYCIHGDHGGCRLTCKTCEAACLCPCHRQPDGEVSDEPAAP